MRPFVLVGRFALSPVTIMEKCLWDDHMCFPISNSRLRLITWQAWQMCSFYMSKVFHMVLAQWENAHSPRVRLAVLFSIRAWRSWFPQ